MEVCGRQLAFTGHHVRSTLSVRDDGIRIRTRAVGVLARRAFLFAYCLLQHVQLTTMFRRLQVSPTASVWLLGYNSRHAQYRAGAASIHLEAPLPRFDLSLVSSYFGWASGIP